MATNPLPIGQIRWLVDREHVSTPQAAIVRLLRDKMTAPEWTKPRRKLAYRIALNIHRENRELCATVIGGRLS